MNFGGLPGRYQIPCNDGFYNVFSNSYGKMQINMQVNGNGKPYMHDLTHYEFP